METYIRSTCMEAAKALTASEAASDAPSERSVLICAHRGAAAHTRVRLCTRAETTRGGRIRTAPKRWPLRAHRRRARCACYASSEGVGASSSGIVSRRDGLAATPLCGGRRARERIEGGLVDVRARRADVEALRIAASQSPASAVRSLNCLIRSRMNAISSGSSRG